MFDPESIRPRPTEGIELYFYGHKPVPIGADGSYVIPPKEPLFVVSQAPAVDLAGFIASCGGLWVAAVTFEGEVTFEHVVALDYVRFEIRMLDLKRRGITDDLVSFIRPFTELRELYLGKNDYLTGGAMRHLRPMRELVILELHGSRVDDAGLADFLPLPNIQQIDLSATFVSDASAPLFAQCPKLQRLSLHGTPFTLKGAETLRKALPSIHIGGVRR